MKKSRKRLLIVSLVGAALVCSLVIILSESGYVFSVAEESSTGNVVTGPATLPPLTSQEEAINLADGFLRETLGEEFFLTHFIFVKVDERPDLFSTWFVIYEYTSNGYTVEMKVAINTGRIPEDLTRIDVDFSYVILQPLEILISDEEAKRIVQEYGLEPPYIVTLVCKPEFHRIFWKIVRENAENLEIGELVGVIIDAETGEISGAWEKQF